MWRKIKDEILNRGDKFVIAVSGGLDSMFALDFFEQLVKVSNISIIVATFDHDDHPESAKFCTFVEEYCRTRHITCVSGKGYTNREEFMKQGGVEAMHRLQRYKFLKDILDRYDYDAVVTGHHLNDQIETILLRLFRGYPHKYLTMVNSSNFYVYRPFLKVSRAKIKNHATNRGLSWLDDPTNDTDMYERNWIRNTILPQILEKRNVVKSMSKGMAKNEDIDGYISNMLSTNQFYEEDP